MSQPNFGRLTGMVRRCTWRPLYARIRIGGGPGSGKTFGALQIATGLRRPGGVIVLANCGEHQGEAHYAGLTDFYSVDVADVEEAIAKAEGWRDRVDDGTDPRAIGGTVDELAENLPPGSVVILDSLSDAWDATKALADAIKSRLTVPEKVAHGLAWREAGGYWRGLMETLDAAPVHVIACARAKTEPEVVKQGRKSYTFHAPTGLEFRGRDEHRMDLRLMVDSLHRVYSVEGRLDPFNTNQPEALDVAFGRRLAAYLATGRDPGNAAVDVASLPLPGVLYGPQAPVDAPGRPLSPEQEPTQPTVAPATENGTQGKPARKTATWAELQQRGERAHPGADAAAFFDGLRQWARGPDASAPVSLADNGSTAAFSRAGNGHCVELPELADMMAAAQKNRTEAGPGWAAAVAALEGAVAFVDDQTQCLDGMGLDPGDGLWGAMKAAFDFLHEHRVAAEAAGAPGA